MGFEMRSTLKKLLLAGGMVAIGAVAWAQVGPYMTNPVTMMFLTGTGATDQSTPVAPANPLPVTSGVPSSAASAGISSKTTGAAAAASLVLKASAGNFYGAQVNTGASAVWVYLLDVTADPGNGALVGCGTGAHAAGCIVRWYQVPANTTFPIGESPPLAMTNGVVLVCSSTGPFTETQSATCEISGEAK